MKQEKLECILDTAKKMFGRYGIDKTNLNELARLARVAKATLYNYFGSKDQIYLEVLQMEASDIINDLEAVIKGVSSPIVQLRTFAHVKFCSIKKAVNLLNLMREGTERVPPETDIIRENLFKREVDILRAILELGVKEGVFRMNDMLLTARAISYAFRGFEMTWLVRDNCEKIEEYLNIMITTLFNGILVERTQE